MHFVVFTPATVSFSLACADHDTVLTSHKMVGTLGGSLTAKTSSPSLRNCNEWKTFIRMFYKNTHINELIYNIALYFDPSSTSRHADFEVEMLMLAFLA